MSKTFLRTTLAVLLCATVVAFTPLQNEEPESDSPALVLGIMVDQMRPEFIVRYWDSFREDGFRRLYRDGFRFTNVHFDYMPTATGAGHASVYSGTWPSTHGAIGNSWYSRELDRLVNVIEMQGNHGVGSSEGYDGAKGPGAMLTTTFGDELRLHTNWESRVVGVSRKDRGAILPAGHTGDAYWYEGSTGNFVTSSFYRDSLPSWLELFNSQGRALSYLEAAWETYHPIEHYPTHDTDDNRYERPFRGMQTTSFPHDLPTLVAEHGYGPELVSATPFGDELLVDLAIAAIEGEQLGKRGVTDVLSISFSATDAIGHQFGPASVEVHDAYVRLDQYIARLLAYLDEEVGMENVLLFLTSDHGVSHVPDFLADHGIPGGHFDANSSMETLGTYLEGRYGRDFVLSLSNMQIFLDHDFIHQEGLDHETVQRDVARFMLNEEGIGGALTAKALWYSNFDRGIRSRVQNGYHQQRSGDVVLWLEPQRTPGTGTRGTTHGSPWNYDSHAPLIWYGWEIPRGGTSSTEASVTDIASTVATFLRSPFPSGNMGRPLNDYFRQP
jgi:hypothetical protein